MRLVPWDPDVQTVISRIDSDALDLQPNFQRGEVWPKSKKQRLVDSILREWHVPPIHVIENPTTRKQEVLDGQQRLAAIRDFVRGEFSIDGDIEPTDLKIKRLHGVKYHSLPDDVRRQFDQFTLRLYRIIDFNPSEPAELFYRLNQPSNLTGAEQRNAFFGPVRDQIRGIVVEIENQGIGKGEFGFSNARMAYDDVICRVALTILRGTIATKITGNDLVELYRREDSLSEQVHSLVKRTVALFSEVVAGSPKPKFNKATLYTWLIFTARLLSAGNIGENQKSLLSKTLEFFSMPDNDSYRNLFSSAKRPLAELLPIYEDRATSRVADVSSIVLRDLIAWTAFIEISAAATPPDVLQRVRSRLDMMFYSDFDEPESLARRAIDIGWGDLK